MKDFLLFFISVVCINSLYMSEKKVDVKANSIIHNCFINERIGQGYILEPGNVINVILENKSDDGHKTDYIYYLKY